MTNEERIEALERRVRYLENALVVITKEFKVGRDQSELNFLATFGEFANKTQAAHILGVTRATVYNMISDGRLKTTTDGNRVLVRSIYDYINGDEHE